jgi:hypothetical protein
MLSALTKFQGDILRIMQADITSAFSELNKTELKVEAVNVAAALNKILKDKNYTRKIRAAGHTIPSPSQVYAEVRKEWSNIVADAQDIFGDTLITGTGTAGRMEFTIVIWAGTPYRSKIMQRREFKSYREVENIALPMFKQNFERVLVNLMGKDAFKKLEVIGSSPGGAPAGGMGRDGFNFAFSLSHTQSQKGLQAGEALKKQTDLRGGRAGQQKQQAIKKGDVKALAIATGKEAFYNLASSQMAAVMPAVTLATIANDAKRVSIDRAHPSGTTQRISTNIPGNFHVILEFDEINAQRALGEAQGVDINPIRDQWTQWAIGFMDTLTSSQKFADDIWFVEGSDSRDEAYSNLIKETVLGALVKGNKSQLKLKRKRPAKKFTAKSSKTKSKKGKKGSAKKTTRRRAKRGSISKGAPKKRATAWANRGGINPIGLRQLIQKALPDAIARKMSGPPTLQYRTGRFASSATINHIVPMPQSVEIRYGYQDDPYYVFEPESGHPLSSRGRDPKELIGSSIREIAQLIMGNRFGLVRTKREL